MSAQTLEGDIRPHDHARRGSGRRHRDRHPPRYPRGRDRRSSGQADRGDADRQRQRRVRAVAGRHRRDGARGRGWPVSVEGTRSYGIGLARALAAAGLLVLECEQPSREQRRGKGKSDSIDAHLAVLAALRLDATKLPVPRADGDREALRILLVARQVITRSP